MTVPGVEIPGFHENNANSWKAKKARSLIYQYISNSFYQSY